MGLTDWFWNDGKMISNNNYPAPDTGMCQQMSWPLTYDDGINLHAKRCDEEAYFMCQIKCT